MSLQYVGNSAFQQGTLGSSYTAGGTSLVLSSGNGANFPATGDFWVRVQPSATDATGAEIFKCTARSTDTLTVTGAQDGTSNVNHSAGAIVVWVLSASALTQLKADITVGAQGLVLLEQHAASTSATLDFTSSITSNYDSYVIKFVNVIPATNGVNFLMRVSTDGGLNYDSGANYSAVTFGNSSSGSGNGGGTALSGMYVSFGTNTISNNSNWGVCGEIALVAPGSAIYKRIYGKVSYLSTGGTPREQIDLSGAYESATAVNAFQFLFSSGSITSGIIRCYGVVK